MTVVPPARSCFDLRTQSLVLTVSVQPEREMPYLHFEFYHDDATVFTSLPRKKYARAILTTALHEHNFFR